MTRALEAAAYWQLRALCSDVQRCEAIARQARAELVAAQKKQTAALTELGLDATALSFTLDDDALTIAFPEPG